MKKVQIYVDTSVIGGCLDDEFQEWSNNLLSDFQRDYYNLILSDLVISEIEEAPNEVKKIFKNFKKSAKIIIKISPEIIKLSEVYLNHKILSPNYRDDARHIATATVANVDLLVSWNFKHIVHYEKIQKFNAVNIEMGYKPISILTPRE